MHRDLLSQVQGRAVQRPALGRVLLDRMVLVVALPVDRDVGDGILMSSLVAPSPI
jgi:hypothetical protein